jgi:hypothetical protein
LREERLSGGERKVVFFDELYNSRQPIYDDA